MLQLVNLSKSYTDVKSYNTTPVLKNVTLQLPKTGLVFILGKSGSGKTTLLNLLGGLDRFESGDMVIQGNSTVHFKQRNFDNYRNGSVGFIFQDFNLLEDLTVLQNIALSIELQGKKPDLQAISNLLVDIDLTGFEHRKINQLSGGQKQRIAIARAIIKQPKIILADEPTGNLDSETSKNILHLFQKISKDQLVVVVTHDKENAYLWGDRVIEFKDGCILSDLSKDHDLIKKHKNEKNTEIKKGQLVTEEILQQIQVQKETSLQKCFAVTTKQSLKPEPLTCLVQIKSNLPYKLAFKMGTSLLKHKKLASFFIVIFSFFLWQIVTAVTGMGLGSLFVYSAFHKDFDKIKETVDMAAGRDILPDINLFVKQTIKTFSFTFFIVLVVSIFLIGGFVKKTIQFKKKDIGVLRALGARSIDVFKIFLSEGFVICCLITLLLGVSWLIPFTTNDASFLDKEKYTNISNISDSQSSETSFINISNVLVFVKYIVNLFVKSLFKAINQYAPSFLPDFQLSCEQFYRVWDFWYSLPVVYLFTFFLILLVVVLSTFLPIYRFSTKKPIDIILDR